MEKMTEKAVKGIMFIVFVCLISATANAASLEVTCPDCANAAVGSQIVCTVSVNTIPNTVTVFGFDFLYDSGVLSYQFFTKGTLAQNRFAFFDVNQQSSGHLRIGGFEYGTNPLPAGSSGEFLKLTFQVMAKNPCGTKFSNLADDFKCWSANPPIVPILPSGQTFSIMGNSANGTQVGTLVVTEDNNETLTFSITGGNTDNAFAINNSGLITVKDSSRLNCSVIPVYSLKIRAAGCSGFAETDVAVNVNGMTPAVQSGQSFTVNEKSANGALVGTVVVTEDNNETLTFSIIGGNTDNAFAISNAGVITVSDSTKLDCSKISVYTLKIRVAGCSESVETDVTVNVTGTLPVVSSGQSFSVSEKSANGTAFGTVSVTGGSKTMTFSIVSGNTDSAFAINSSGLISVNDSTKLDCSKISVYTLKIRVNGCSGFAETDVTVNVTGTLPVVSSGQSFSVSEKSADGTAVGTVSVTGGSKTMTFSIVSGNTDSAFSINSSGLISVNDSTKLDCSKISVYTLKIRVNGCSGFAETDVTVNVTGTVPVVSSGQSFSVSEKSAVGTAVGTVSFTGGSKTMTFSIVSGNTENAFSINSSGVISVNDSTKLDCSKISVYTLKIRVVGCSGFAETDVTVNVTGTAPVVQSGQSFSVSEKSANGTSVGTVSVTGGSKTMTFSIASGNTDSAFAINNSGVISVNDSTKLDCSKISVYTLKIRVNGCSGFAETDVTVNVTGTLPVVSSGQSFSVSEKSANGTAVGTVSVTGGSKTMTFSIASGNTENAFAINSSGVISVSDSTKLDCSKISVYTLKIRVTGCSGFAEADVTVNVTGTEPVVPSGQSFPVSEKSANGISVGTVSVTGGSKTMTFSIVSGNTDSAFAINNSGVISVKDSTKLDCSKISVYTLKIRVNGCSGFAEADVTVNVTGTEPVVPSGQSFSVNENSADGTVIGTVTVIGGSQPMTFTILDGNKEDVFDINNSGEITVKNSNNLDSCLNPDYSLTIKVSCLTGSAQTTVIVYIDVKGDVNDDCKTDLQDAILTLQILTGIQTGPVNLAADVNNDGRIGMEEAIFIMRNAAGIK